MSKDRRKRVPVLALLAAIGAFFYGSSQIFYWMAMSQQDFAIPVAGKRILTTRDGWQSETEQVVADMNAFWAEALASQGADYSAVTLSTTVQGLRPLCGGPPARGVTAYCPQALRLEVDLGDLAGVSRHAPTGKPHLAVAFALSHLMGYHVQGQSGRALAPDRAATHAKRSTCLAGVWLQGATARYGPVSLRDLRRVARGTFVGPAPERAQTRDAWVLDLRPATSESRATWATRGFQAKDLSDCFADDG